MTKHKIIVFLLQFTGFVFFHVNCCCTSTTARTGTNVSMNNPIVVQNPEISQAFYSTLKGSIPLQLVILNHFQ
jgi:hypothetical protein